MLAISSLISGGRYVGIVRSRTQAIETSPDKYFALGVFVATVPLLWPETLGSFVDDGLKGGNRKESRYLCWNN
jgi:hypothetical protein